MCIAEYYLIMLKNQTPKYDVHTHTPRMHMHTYLPKKCHDFYYNL